MQPHTPSPLLPHSHSEFGQTELIPGDHTATPANSQPTHSHPLFPSLPVLTLANHLRNGIIISHSPSHRTTNLSHRRNQGIRRKHTIVSGDAADNRGSAGNSNGERR
ncbi:hypothetical protein Hdeb2414_s0017g00512921 [Helianthus debilis subsp. tardiflorus]